VLHDVPVHVLVMPPPHVVWPETCFSAVPAWVRRCVRASVLNIVIPKSKKC